MGQGQGLSAMGAEQQEAPATEQGETGAQEQQEGPKGISLEDIVKALMSGVTPKQLLEAGVPEELIKQAIQIIQQHAAQVGQGHPQGQGLSAAGMQ